MTLRYLPVSSAESVQYYTGHSNEQHSSKQSQVLYEGYSASEHRSHITIQLLQHRQMSLAQQRATISPATTIATSRAPNHPSTRTPCKDQLTLQKLAELPHAGWAATLSFASGGVAALHQSSTLCYSFTLSA
jgi:hypothetical protein